MKYLYTIILFLIITGTCYAGKDVDYKEGDIIFQTSLSNQSKYIAYATGSMLTHCGIIVIEDSKIYVLEVSNIVKLTPYLKWIENSFLTGTSSIRVFNKDVKIDYKSYIGKIYDTSFKQGNDMYYCSELVYDIYLNQFGIELAPMKQVKEYNIRGLEDILKKRNISKEQYVIAPSDIFETQYAKSKR